MRRRIFISLLAGMAGWPVVARAQQPKALPRVVYLDRQGTPSPWVAGLLSGLREEGYVDGKNISLMRKEIATSTVAAMKDAIAEILDHVDVLVVGGTIGGVAAKSATSTIPVVFISSVLPWISDWSKASLIPVAT